jgi:hypothetical protein
MQPEPLTLTNGHQLIPCTLFPPNTVMTKTLIQRMFGTRKARDSAPTALKKEQTLAKINEPDPGARPRARRTVGLTEERLRAANQRSWITSAKGWSGLFGRFTR